MAAGFTHHCRTPVRLAAQVCVRDYAWIMRRGVGRVRVSCTISSCSCFRSGLAAKKGNCRVFFGQDEYAAVAVVGAGKLTAGYNEQEEVCSGAPRGGSRVESKGRGTPEERTQFQPQNFTEKGNKFAPAAHRIGGGGQAPGPPVYSAHAQGGAMSSTVFVSSCVTSLCVLDCALHLHL